MKLKKDNLPQNLPYFYGSLKNKKQLYNSKPQFVYSVAKEKISTPLKIVVTNIVWETAWQGG